MFKKLAKYVKEYKKSAILTPIFVILEVVMEVIIPLLMAKIIDVGIQNGDVKYIVEIGGLLIISAILSLTFGMLSGRFAAKASAGYAKNLRKEMFHKVQDYSFENIDKFSTSSLVTRMTTDVTNVQMAFQMIIRILVRGPIMMIFALLMVMSISMKLSAVFFVAIPVLGGILFYIAKKAHPNFERVFKKYDKLNRVVQEDLSGIRVVKAYAKEDYEKEKFKKVNDEVIEIEKEIKYQTIEEFELFMHNVTDTHWYAFFNFLFWHGLRKGEQQAITWKDIDFENEVVKINKTVSKSKSGGIKITNTKNKRNRVIYLASQSIEPLTKLYNQMKYMNSFTDDWFVFGYGPNKDNIVARNTIDRKLKNIYSLIIETYPEKKINVLTHHEFGRHSHASYLLNKGMGREDIYNIIALRLGDSERVIRETYAHPYENLNNDKTRDLLK